MCAHVYECKEDDTSQNCVCGVCLGECQGKIEGKSAEERARRMSELYPPALAAALGRLSKPCLGGFGAQIEIIPHSDTHAQLGTNTHTKQTTHAEVGTALLQLTRTQHHAADSTFTSPTHTQTHAQSVYGFHTAEHSDISAAP